MKKLVLLLLLACCRVAFGADPITLPFEMDFISNKSLAPNEGYLIKEWKASYSGWGVDGKGGLWATYNGYYGKQGEVCAHKNITADAWLISPPLPLETGKGYQVTYTVRRYEGNTEKLNIGVAGTTSIEAIKEGTILYKDHEIINDDWVTRIFTFRSDVGGNDCCIGFQCISEPLPENPSKVTFVGLGYFKIEEYDMPEPVVPETVTNFIVGPSEEKPLTAVLSWTNPIKGTLDEDLDPSETLTAKIYRNNEEIAIIKDLVAGQPTSYEDKVTAEGDYTYGISIGLTGIYGETATATDACSLLKFYPEMIMDGRVASQELDVTLTWTNPLKFTNGKIIKDNISVDIYRNDTFLTTTEQTPGETAAYTDKVPEAGNYIYYLVPKSREGTEGETSGIIDAGYITGAIILPYNALTSEFLNWTSTDENHDGLTWTLSSNKDNYSCQCAAGGQDILKSPLLKATAGNYKLSFVIKRINVPVGFTVNCVTIDGTTEELLKETDYTSEAKASKYAEVTFKADTKFYITVDLKSSGSGASFVIDNITLKNMITPGPATGLTIVPDPKKELKAAISWKNPETGTNNETFDNFLSAEIYRNDVLIKTLEDLDAGETCNYTDNVPESAIYSYAVRIGFEGTYGEKVSSGEYEVGKVYHPLLLPYSIEFTTNAPEGTTDPVNTSHVYYNGTWTLINPNGNMGYGKGGVWNERTEEGSGAVCRHYGNTPTNAWIISPALPLSKDKAYAVTYSYKRIPYKTFDKDIYMDEMFEVALGTEVNPDNLKRTILSTHLVTNNEFITITKKFVVSEDGDYYIGIHCISEKGYSSSTGLAIGSFAMEETTIVKPAEITGFTATPDKTKELTADLTWTNPSLGEDGNPLSTDTDLTVEVYRNGKLIETLTVDPGSNSTWSETVEKAGAYTYIVKSGQYGIYSAGVSATCQLENFIPEKVTDLTYAIEDEMNVVLKWTTPTTYTNNITMTGNVEIDLYRDDNRIADKNMEPGARGEYKDELIDYGTYIYYVKVRLPNGMVSEKSADVQVTTMTSIEQVNASKGYYDRRTGIFHLAVPSSGVAVYSLTGICMLKETKETNFIDLNPLSGGTYLLEIDGCIVKIIK